MAYVITPGCCSDASCIAVCPVNCIHPTPDEPEFGTTASLFVDPATCIDCGACADACPVDAIGPADMLRGPDQVFIDVNRDFYRDRPSRTVVSPQFAATLPHALSPLDVAVVGTGPAAHYAADLLLRSLGAEVTMFDRLPVAGGLLRYGVAPDHPSTRQLGDRFTGFLHNPKLHMMLGVEVGSDVTAAELDDHFDAVVYAVGASTSRDLGIPGEHLVGSTSATDLVAWYNGHPDNADQTPPLTGERAVIIGNGNVALDVARIMLADPDALGTTDIADHALSALRTSQVREVVVAARRGPEHAAYTSGELHALKQLPGIELVVAGDERLAEYLRRLAPDSPAAILSDVPVLTLDYDAPPRPGRRIVLQFSATPREIVGERCVDAVVFEPAGPTEPGSGDAEPGTAAAARFCVRTGLVVRAIGYRGEPIADLPFDERTHTVPNRDGRVVDPAGEVVAGRYVVGWIKRGAVGGIGANRQDAKATVTALIDDVVAGRLRRPRSAARSLRSSLARRLPEVVDRAGVLAIDAAERSAGARAGRPRVKLTSREQLTAAARG